MSDAEDRAREWLAEVERVSTQDFHPAGSWDTRSALRGGTSHVRDLLAELERAKVVAEWLIAEQRYQLRLDPGTLEIINGWLVERGVHPGEYIPGYGTYPYSDAEPILRLSELPGWPTAVADIFDEAEERAQRAD